MSLSRPAHATARRLLATGFCTLAALLLAAALLAGPAGGADAAPELTLLAAGDMRGEIKPCGCSPEGQLGGLPRRLTFLERAFAGGGPKPILVDLGNNFPEPSEQGRLKIDLIQSLLAEHPPAAILPGPNELDNGVSLMSRELPWVASNDAVNDLFAPHATVSRKGLRVGIYGYLSPELVYQEFSPQYRFVPLSDDLLERWREARAEAGHERTVLLFRGSDAELATIVRAGLFDRIVVGNRYGDELNQELRREAGGTVLPQVPTKGQGLYRLPLTAAALEPPEPVWLTGEYADHPVAVHAMGIYDDKVKGLFFARLETKAQRAEASPYIGAAACAACHPAAAETWRATRHADALAALVNVGKQFDPECLACHVVGLGEEGFLSAELTPQLANVQCENCHGAGRAHAADPANVPTARVKQAVADHGSPEAICRECHHGSHSPTFDFAEYWPKIAHGADAAARAHGASPSPAGPPAGSPPSPTSDLRPVPASERSASARDR